MQISGTDVSIESSVVSNFLKSVSAKENGNGSSAQPVKNSSHLYKPPPKPLSEPPIVNHLGLKKVNNSVLNKVKELNKNCDEQVVLRTKSEPLPEPPSAFRTSTDDQYKSKYEEAERRRKELLTESQKLKREKSGLEQRLKKIEDDYKRLNEEFSDKAQQLNKLRRVSEQVYQDYDKLNNKYETETTTLHKALEVASKWYKENKKLKRESIALRSSALPHALDMIKDETDGEDTQSQDELDELRKNVQDLSNQVGQLQFELNRARLQEFEAQEQFINLTQQLDEERSRKEKMEKELKDLRLMKEKFESVTYMVHDEVQALKAERDRANEAATRLQAEAHQAQKERNVLAHQSSLLMGEISSNETLMKVLLEVEDLKRKLEEESQNHAAEVQRLQEKLEFRESEAQLELMEEKLRLAESELQLALERAEQAEQAEASLNNKVSELKSKLETGNSTAAPPPPPPPPPPPMIPGTGPILKKTEHKAKFTNANSLDDMAHILGIQRVHKNNQVPGGAIDDIINEIKGGKFTLKATEKQQMKKEEQPPAVQEMLNIIGTLKRRPHRSKIPADVQL